MKIIFTIIFFCSFVLFGQNQLDNSIRLFYESSSNIEKAQLASDISWELKNIKPDSSLFYAKEALRLAILTNQPKIQAYSLSDIGNYYKRKEEYAHALTFYFKSLTIRQQLKDEKLIVSTYNQIALLYKQQENYDSAAYYFEKGIELLRKNPDPKTTLQLYDGYAMTLYHLGHSEVALAYLDSSFVLAESIQDSSVIANVLQRKGVIHQYLGHPLLAMKFYDQAQDYYTRLGDTNGEIDIKINRATVYLMQGDRMKAEELLLEAEKQSDSDGFQNNLFTIYTNLAELYGNDVSKSRIYYQKAYKNAKEFEKVQAQIESCIPLGFIALKCSEIEEANNLIREIESKLTLKFPQQIRYDFYRLKSYYYSLNNDFKNALIFSDMALILKDSLHEDLNHLQDLSAILENERHEKEIALEELKTSQAENESIQARANLNQIIIWSLITIIFFLILLFINKRKRSKIELQKKIQEERFKTELKQKETEAELIFLEESLKLETEIRQKIGRDLHDNLGSKLAVIQITLEGISKGGELSASEEIETINQLTNLIEESCKDMREISHDLIQQDKAAQSLNMFFVNHCDSIAKTGNIVIEYTLVGDPYPISREIKKHLLGTVALLLDNVLKHAKAKKVSLQLFYHDDSLNVEIVDDGIGFDQNLVNLSGVGLQNAKLRINQIGGTIEFDSNLNKGTIISISIPITNEC
jgi:two-component system NarL family sensor kinase